MKKIFENKVFQAGLMAFAVISASIIFYFFMRNLSGIIKFIGFIINIIEPLIVGFIMAYIMHPIVKFFDKTLFKGIKKDSVKRTLSITLTLVIIISLLTALISVIIPQLLNSIESLIVNVPEYFNNAQSYIKEWVTNSDTESAILSNYDTISKNIIDAVNTNILPVTEDAISKIGNGVVGFGKALFNLAVGTVFAVYILANTKNFAAGFRKTLYSLFNVDKVNGFIDEIKHINKVFANFMIGKICDSMCFVFISTLTFLLIFNYPYPLLIAVIIGLTDLIPYFGPYIGSVPSALLICMISPVKALTFCLFMIVLQQIDGNFVTPHIQKTATGLPSFWVLFAITFFGGLFGVVGMIIGVPCFTIIYELIMDQINRRLKKKNLPTDTEYYKNIDGLQEKVIKSRLLSKRKIVKDAE